MERRLLKRPEPDMKTRQSTNAALPTVLLVATETNERATLQAIL
jgi:hypothetical protein